RYQLRIAARARELVDHGTPIEAACRIVILEDQLEEAQRINAEHRRAAGPANPTAAA
ncbi:MerR family transcriptional regulator, partial [Streptomyces sp. NPDC005134]